MPWGRGKLQVLVLSGFLLCSFFSGLAMGRDDPLEVLWITDDSWIRHDSQFLRKEPMIDALFVLSRGKSWGGMSPGWGLAPGTGADELTRVEVLRMVRRYFPRTYQELVGNYEFIVLKSMEIAHFTSANLEWMRKAIEEEGLGGLTELHISGPIYQTQSAWAESSLSAVFPNDAEAVVAAEEGYDLVKGSFEMIINHDPTLPPVLTRYKDYLALEFWVQGFRYIYPKEGARTYAWAKTDIIPQFLTTRNGTFHYLLGWQYGEAYTWSLGGMSGSGPWWSGDYQGQTYLGGDAYIAMLRYSTGRGIPEDVLMVHKLKERFYEYSEKKGFIISMVEFVEKFGANTNPLMVKVLAMDNRWEEARSLYISQDYDGSWSLFDQLLVDVDSFTNDALKLKDRTLFWIYVSEWCIITGTSIFAGFILWTLMVKRRYYKMVDQTRLRPPPGEVGTEPMEYRDSNRPWWRKDRLRGLFAIH